MIGSIFVELLVPARECRQKDETEECENDSNNTVRVLALSRNNKGKVTHRRYGNTTASLNVEATQIRFIGS
jgi:transcriptional regulator of NAD metabolism